MSPPGIFIRLIHLALRVSVSLIVAVVCAWSAGAIFFDAPFAAEVRTTLAVVWLAFALILWFIMRRRPKARALVILGFTLITAWWFTLQPRNDRPWQPNAAQTPWAEVNGDTVTLHNVRNCDYRTGGDFTVHWETRTLDLSRLTGLDIALSNWGAPWMAHPILCFQFSDAPPLAFSIEMRKELGEPHSSIAGLYRRYELMIVAGDERDLLRTRTNYRKGEKVYLYRSTAPPVAIRERFMEYVSTMNDLHQRARWYNVVTTNCTTAVRTQRDVSKRIPWDWRMLLNGKLDELCYERGVIATDGLTFQELKSRALINAAAVAADRSADFSREIRKDRPGFKM